MPEGDRQRWAGGRLSNVKQLMDLIDTRQDQCQQLNLHQNWTHSIFFYCMHNCTFHFLYEWSECVRERPHCVSPYGEVHDAEYESSRWTRSSVQPIQLSHSLTALLCVCMSRSIIKSFIVCIYRVQVLQRCAGGRWGGRLHTPVVMQHCSVLVYIISWWDEWSWA